MKASLRLALMAMLGRFVQSGGGEIAAARPICVGASLWPRMQTRPSFITRRGRSCCRRVGEKGVPVQPWRFFKKIGEHLLAKGLGFVLLARHDNRCIAGAVFLHYNQTLTCKYAASLKADQVFRPNNLLFWEGIEWGCRRGYRWLDLGRTELENTGLRRFKDGWGCCEEALVYSNFGVSSQARWSGRLKSCTEKIIRTSPAWVCSTVGSVLYRYMA
jgi:hypothetical protein